MAQAVGLGEMKSNGEQKIKAKHGDGTQGLTVRLQPGSVVRCAVRSQGGLRN